MQTQNDEFNSKKSLATDIKKYIDLRVEYLQLTFVEKTSLLIGKLALVGAIGLFALALGMLLMLLTYNLLMMWIGISWVVTLIEMGIVAVLLVFLWIFKNELIIRPVANMIVNVLYNNQSDNQPISKQDNEKV